MLPTLQGELDELEREEFFRLKKVQGNKKKNADLAAARVSTGLGNERVGADCKGTRMICRALLKKSSMHTPLPLAHLSV